MEKTQNTLPIQTYVRSRVNTIVVDIGNQSSGSVPLNLDKPSDVTVIIASDANSGTPYIFIGAIGRQPSMDNFDVIISPVDMQYAKLQDKMTLHLPQTASTFYWKSLSVEGTVLAFPELASRLVLAIDQ